MRRAKTGALLFDRLLFERQYFKPTGAPSTSASSDSELIAIDRSEYALRVQSGQPSVEWDTFHYFRDVPPAAAQTPFSGLPEALAELGADWIGEVWPHSASMHMSISSADVPSSAELLPTPQESAEYHDLLMRRYDASGVFSAGNHLQDAFASGSGGLAVAIAVPDIAHLPWEAIAQFREHPASREARERFSGWEREAMQDTVDADHFQLTVAQAITRDLTAAAREAQPSVLRELGQECAETAIGLIPIVGSVVAPGIAMTQIIRQARHRRKSWLSALMRLQGV